jgi:hypothetical protein
MDWEPEVKKKFDDMIAMIPFFQRKMAERLGGKKAEENAASRGSASVGEADVVSAFLTETPGPFRAGMRENALKAGFDMPEV